MTEREIHKKLRRLNNRLALEEDWEQYLAIEMEIVTLEAMIQQMEAAR